jgi:hypothetical protein
VSTLTLLIWSGRDGTAAPQLSSPRSSVRLRRDNCDQSFDNQRPLEQPLSSPFQIVCGHLVLIVDMTGHVGFPSKAFRAAMRAKETIIFILLVVFQLLDRDSEYEPVIQLLRLLTHLPLAIVQVIAYINENDISISEYVAIYKRDSKKDIIEVLGEDFEDQARYRDIENHVATTCLISFEQV